MRVSVLQGRIIDVTVFEYLCDVISEDLGSNLLQGKPHTYMLCS